MTQRLKFKILKKKNKWHYCLDPEINDNKTQHPNTLTTACQSEMTSKYNVTTKKPGRFVHSISKWMSSGLMFEVKKEVFLTKGILYVLDHSSDAFSLFSRFFCNVTRLWVVFFELRILCLSNIHLQKK